MSGTPQSDAAAPDTASSPSGREDVAKSDENEILPQISEPNVSWLIALCVGIGVIVFGADIQLPKGVAMGVPHVLVILFSLRIGDGRVTYGFAVADPWMVLMNRLVALLAIWSSAFMGIRFKNLVAAQKSLLTEKELALKEIKILKGQLPICAHCKRIRDVQDQWLQLEEYLLDHSEARFSHGICPECLKENFPEYLTR
jgi:hypothetical protein